ncbi:hypothetical protein LCGC14_3153030 [marine sediment metagenome]|uniref:Uncharacterized protein n=1 Tax=marine sediment metagenome TaxID=412755 RepID=A0A0F8WHK2_9ZZZZ
MRMSKRAEKALRASIKHWEIDVLENGELPIRMGCKLCNVYYCSFTCPISKRTGKLYCEKTAYSSYRYKHRHSDNTPEMKEQARRMIKFMKSLLPKKGKL